ncbi:hypothetical protein XCR1_1650016 [Xenorhabdus cabanillasii JM26]|uniref:Uncharacterized protein n=1 Tax=Xenorhabdus cabanillasii JM26 TaxID=1427517 RepID=W1IYA3_9GAMM|nr:hypothetical protein XCR1_1650016 [Xenorhabdus cabanillasii JM26]
MSLEQTPPIKGHLKDDRYTRKVFSLAYGESVLLRHAFSIYVDQQGKDRL